MSAIYVLWLRELRRYVRSRAQLVASLGQPILYLVALGFGLGPVFQRAGQGSYVQFVAPGIIAMTVLFSSSASGSSAIHLWTFAALVRSALGQWQWRPAGTAWLNWPNISRICCLPISPTQRLCYPIGERPGRRAIYK